MEPMRTLFLIISRFCSMVMIDLEHLEKYRENNRIEAKLALGGLPHSIWETYCAFANTLGGIILLGVEEKKDKTLHPVDLPDPRRLIREFWEMVNDPKKISVNILSVQDVQEEIVDGCHIIVITVPRARRYDRPVYMDGDPFMGAYRRNGEGDYRCAPEEVEAMLRDAQIHTRDMTILEEMDMGALDVSSVARYRRRMERCRPDHAWERETDTEFLCRVGAAGKSADGSIHPTAAGLLMFGRVDEIRREFPAYRLIYREYDGLGLTETFSLISGEKGWSGNVFDFYFIVYDRIARGLRLPGAKVGWDVGGKKKVGGKTATGDEPEVDEELDPDPAVCQALREALANCLANADYYGRQGVAVTRKRDEISFTNPGGFRIDPKRAVKGGISDPRNEALVRLFHLVDIGNRTGSGLSGIYRVWRSHGWKRPVICEEFEPERITMVLAIQEQDDRQMVVDYLTEQVQASAEEMAEVLGIRRAKAAEYLEELVASEIAETRGEDPDKIYRLKS